MRVKITKGTVVEGVGRVKKGKVVEVSDGVGQFLVNIGQATVASEADLKVEGDKDDGSKPQGKGK